LNWGDRCPKRLNGSIPAIVSSTVGSSGTGGWAGFCVPFGQKSRNFWRIATAEVLDKRRHGRLKVLSFVQTRLDF